jgi:serine/threonine protein kinase
MPWCEKVNSSELDDVSDSEVEAQCVEELLGALHALHHLGVLHGDVKKWSNHTVVVHARHVAVTCSGAPCRVLADSERVSDWRNSLTLNLDGRSSTARHGARGARQPRDI